MPAGTGAPPDSMTSSYIYPDFSVCFGFSSAGSEPIELLREFKLLGEVLDLVQSNLLVVGTQV